jgi:hypothetical protein
MGSIMFVEISFQDVIEETALNNDRTSLHITNKLIWKEKRKSTVILSNTPI